MVRIKIMPLRATSAAASNSSAMRLPPFLTAMDTATTQNNRATIEVDLNDFEREIDEMLMRYEHQSVIPTPFDFMEQHLISKNLSLDKKCLENFIQYFLQRSFERLTVDYKKVQLLLQLQSKLALNSVSNNNAASNMDSVIEILESDDEDVENRSQGRNGNGNALNAMAHYNNIGDTHENWQIEPVADIKCKPEKIDENIPIVTVATMVESSIRNISNEEESDGEYSMKLRSGRRMQKPIRRSLSPETPCLNRTKAGGSKQQRQFNKHTETRTARMPLECGRCFKRFTSKHNLKIHFKVHKDEFPFHCRRCFKGFDQRKKMQNHANHCQIQCYECHKCEKFATRNKNDFRKHMRTHAGEQLFR